MDVFRLDLVKRGMCMRFGRQKGSSKDYSLKVVVLEVMTNGDRSVSELKLVLLCSDQCPKNLPNF